MVRSNDFPNWVEMLYFVVRPYRQLTSTAKFDTVFFEYTLFNDMFAQCLNFFVSLVELKPLVRRN